MNNDSTTDMTDTTTDIMIEQYIKTLSTMEKNELTISVKMFINNLANNLHNVSLIRDNQSPNANTIYHLYSDGEITYQKGGWAYGKRTEFTHKYPILNNSTFFTFANKINENMTYIVCSMKSCEIIRNLMEQLVNYINLN